MWRDKSSSCCPSTRSSLEKRPLFCPAVQHQGHIFLMCAPASLVPLPWGSVLQGFVRAGVEEAGAGVAAVGCRGQVCGCTAGRALLHVKPPPVARMSEWRFFALCSGLFPSLFSRSSFTIRRTLRLRLRKFVSKSWPQLMAVLCHRTCDVHRTCSSGTPARRWRCC